MHEQLLSALLRKLAAEPERDTVDLWPGIHETLNSQLPQATSPLRPERPPASPASGYAFLRGHRFPRLAAVAATVAISLAVLATSTLQPWGRPTSANAAEIFAGLRTEAFYDGGNHPDFQVVTFTITQACPSGGLLVTGPGATPPPGATGPTGVFQVTSGGPIGVQQVAPFSVVGANPGSSLTPGPVFNVSTAQISGIFTPGTAITGGQQPAPGVPVGMGIAIQGEASVQPGVVGGIIIGSESLPPPPGGPGVSSITVLPGSTELSDRLGQELGISGERVREAMRQTVGFMPQPVDPFTSVANQLGVSVDRVREAFADPACPGMISIMLRPSPRDVSGPAQRLGVSPERLAAAVAAAAPPPPPSFDDTINRLAQNLGVTPAQLRTALQKVEGPNHLYIAVPALPGAPTPSINPTAVPTPHR